MRTLLFLLKVLLSESKNNGFILKAILSSTVYITTALIIVNYKSYTSFIFNDYPILAKFKIMALIFLGTYQAMTTRDIFLLIIIGLLFGLNIALVISKIKFLKKQGSVHLTFGVGLLTLAATGCASCGLSLVSLVGLTSALVSLPFHGLELYILSIFILLTSLFYNLQTLVVVCKIPRH